MSTPETNYWRKIRKDRIKKIMASGDKRSFNELDADIELQNWTERFHPDPTKQRRKLKPSI